ncbi:MAG: peptidoglycan DD-metalloendopeptidase family protein [Reyranellaceae bacterium]
MTNEGSKPGLFARWKEAARHRFPDREVIVRANGQVAYLQISHRRQVMALGAVTAVAAWALYASVSYVVFDRRLADKNVEIEQAVTAYRTLKHNLTDAETKFVEIARNLEERNGQLHSVQDQNAALRRNLSAIETVLDSVVAQRTRIATERQSLETRNVMLEARLKQMQSAQADVLGRLGQRTLGELAEVERVLAMTGLDADTMLNRSGASRTGQGGPFIPALGGRDFDGLVEPVNFTAAILDAHIDRLEGLQRLLRILPLTVPADTYTLSSGFGLRRDPVNGAPAMHYGLDFAGNAGQSITATAPGRVIFAERMGFYGKMVEIDHGMGVTTRYGHLKTILAEEGQMVAAGEKIGTMGSTGRSTGVHVHYEIRVDGQPVNPMKFIKAGRYVLKAQQ